jgi:hypothetical protein
VAALYHPDIMIELEATAAVLATWGYRDDGLIDPLTRLSCSALALGSAYFLIDVGSTIAKRYNNSTVITDNTDLVPGSILGGNLFNIGVTASLVVYVAAVNKPVFWRSMGALLLAIYVAYIANALLQ